MAWFYFALGASILWGLSYVLSQIVLKDFDIVEFSLFKAGFTFLVLLIYFMIYGDKKHFFNKLFLVKPLFYITLSGVVYIVATLLILKSITVSNASVAAAIESSYPIFTIFFVYIFLNEYQLNFMQLIGCLLIISGIIMIKFYTGR